MLLNTALLLSIVAAPAPANSVNTPSVGMKTLIEQPVHKKVAKDGQAAFEDALKQQRQQRPTSLLDLLEPGTDPKSLLGGSIQGGMLGAGVGAPGVNAGTVTQGGVELTYFTVTIDPGSGYGEQFIVYAPNPMPAVARPMLVAFHGFGVSQKDITVNTDFVKKCAARGWFMLAPLSASGGHFMSDPGMTNTQAAMDWAMAALNVDPTRIYGVGFSMGGGMALNYAARHMDPSRGMFAGVVSHTGTVDLNDAYESDPASQFVFDFWYGDESALSAEPDLMVKSSLIQWIPYYQQVNPNNDLARNLTHLPMKLVRADNDPLAYIGVQNDRLHQHMQSLGRQPGPNYSYEVLSGDEHTWDTLDADGALDWLAQFTLQLPSNARTLATSESTYFHFFVDQEQPGQLTPFTWDIDNIANEIRITDTENLSLLAVDTESAGLSTTQQLQVVLSAADGAADKVLLTGYDAPPLNVLRDGVQAVAGSWTYNAIGKSVVITETEATAVHTWTVIP